MKFKIPSPEQEHKFWEQRLDKGWGEDKSPDIHFSSFVDKYKDEIGPKILDIGSGRGRHILPLAELGYQVVGLEFAQSGLRATKNKLAEKKIEATLVQGDFRKLPFAPETFNTAISIQVLNQSNDWQGAKRAFSEVGRVLKPGGLFFLRVRSNLIPLPKDSEIIAESVDNEVLVADRGVTYIKNRKVIENEEPTQRVLQHAFSYEELQKLAAKYGMSIIDESDQKERTGEKSHWNLVFRKNS